MFTKILVTTLVIVVMLMVARSGVLNPKTRGSPSGRPPPSPEKTLFPKVAALVVLLLVIALGGLLFYLDWREDHRIMDIAEAAEYLHIKTWTLYRHVKTGKIPGTKIGGQWRFKKEVLDEMQDSVR